MKKDKLEIAYSIGIVIAVPVLVALNTVLLTQSTRNAYNNELRRKADLVNVVIASTVQSDIVDQDVPALASALNRLESAQPAITKTSIITRQQPSGDLSILAKAQDTPDKLSANAELQAKIAFERELPIAQLIDSTDKDGKLAQAWQVLTPVIGQDGTVLAVVASSVSTADAQEAIDKAYMTSFIVLLISVVVIVLLLAHHFRLVQNGYLLAKQKEINQTMVDFLSVATHELNAPTSIIKGYISLVTDGTFGPVNQKIQEQLNTAMAQTDRLNSLVKDLLNVSRIEQGRIAYDIKPVDSAKLLGTIAENYRQIAGRKGLEVVVQLQEDTPSVLADEGRVQEIFTNLIDNAVKYTEKGSVTASQRVERGMVVTTIKDTGFGMSSKDRQRLFQRFYRVQTDKTRNISGTGLGLWIIRQYVLAMHGTIDVESMEGVGSEFVVALPIAKK